jgi:acyl-coenzyme A thioesterase PaaI-like protein
VPGCAGLAGLALPWQGSNPWSLIIAPARPNQLQRLQSVIEGLPRALQPAVISFLLGQVVPFVGTVRLRFEEISHDQVVVSIKNRRRVQNHIHGVHAAAVALLAETASGFCVGRHLPDDKLPLLKRMQVDYLHRSTGGLVAVARLTPEQIAIISAQDKGEVQVQVRVTDEAGGEPVHCDMLWAWVSKPKKA